MPLSFARKPAHDDSTIDVLPVLANAGVAGWAGGTGVALLNVPPYPALIIGIIFGIVALCTGWYGA